MVLIFLEMLEDMGQVVLGRELIISLKEVVKEFLAVLIQQEFLALIMAVKSWTPHISTVNNFLNGNDVVVFFIE